MSKIFTKKKLLSTIISGLITGVAVAGINYYYKLPADDWLMLGIELFIFSLIGSLLSWLWKKMRKAKESEL
ncbi:MAG: hypothetical protein LBC98_00855 [Prevotellaceae bacterium]|jgi:hypothetical protein|nr:hypothetical protein [Prevotellaceae bacterium]